MSSPTGPDASTIVEIFQSLTIANDCEIASLAFIVWEHLITFDQEVRFFWRQKLTGAAVLFVSNRYLVLLLYALNVFGTMRPLSDQSCSSLAKFTYALGVIQYFAWAVFSGLRAFALSRSRILSGLSLVPFAINLVPYGFGLTGVNDPLFGCTPINPMSRQLARSFTISARTSLIVADILLIATTWYTLRRVGTVRNRTGGSTLSFASVLLRDGTVYFVILLILNILHLVFTMLSIEIVLQPSSYITLFTNPITAIIVSRFLLHLQAANEKAVDPDTSYETPYQASLDVGTLVFEAGGGSIAPSISIRRESISERCGDDIIELSNRSVPGHQDEEKHEHGMHD